MRVWLTINVTSPVQFDDLYLYKIPLKIPKQIILFLLDSSVLDIYNEDTYYI